MKFYPQERLGVFIDGQNTWLAAKTLGFDIDYKAFLDTFAERAMVGRALYFTPLHDGEDFNPMRRLADWLSFNGFEVVTKPQGSIDVDLAVSMIGMAGAIDHFVLASGNHNFLPVLDAVQARGCRVTVVSTIKNSPMTCSEDIRRTADAFVDLADLQPIITRPARAFKETVHA